MLLPEDFNIRFHFGGAIMYEKIRSIALDQKLQEIYNIFRIGKCLLARQVIFYRIYLIFAQFQMFLQIRISQRKSFCKT
uniref:Uncharacterized protein n=1 Tax=Lotus japonicus TaxID=34305 RepID=I3SXP7_LOTJA|nr:unknown [Lotus japonicus]